jgi:hypothetical protein
MQLVYTDPEEATIHVTLDEGETLDDLIGPMEAFVPTDPTNRHYAEIVEGDYTIDAYEAPAQVEEDGETTTTIIRRTK